jgi:nucleotide-binding universal stress UspA family protein
MGGRVSIPSAPVRPEERDNMYPIRKILHPTDFSNESGAALCLACSLAKQLGAEVVVLHVIPPPKTWGEEIARRPPDSYEGELWNEYLLPIHSTEPGVSLARRLEEGVPEEVIDRVAAELPADLIVMGTHGRQGVSRLLMGSVAEHVIRTAPCPVLTTRGALPETVPSTEMTATSQEPAP